MKETRHVSGLVSVGVQLIGIGIMVVGLAAFLPVLLLLLSGTFRGSGVVGGGLGFFAGLGTGGGLMIIGLGVVFVGRGLRS